jgi:predicted RND superfamily exporter protein
MWIKKNRAIILSVFGLFIVAALALLPFLKFSFDFEQFFPDNDPDLEFYREFISEFESDDNYLLLALEAESSISDPAFLNTVKKLSNELSDVDYVENVISIPTITIPIVSPFGFSFKPLVNISNQTDIIQFFQNQNHKSTSFSRLISKDEKSLAIILKVKEHIEISESRILISNIERHIAAYNFDDYHLLGRAYFQDELSRLQLTEILYSSLGSILLVSIMLFIIYRNKFLIFITLLSITVGLVLFLGLLALLGRELNAMSALYPVLMLIVGTSDVIHIMSKYLDELRNKNTISVALDKTIRQIGVATLFTSLTTAVGFLSLMTSRIEPVRGFGMNAALGVFVAYVTIMLFTTALLTYFSPEKLNAHSRNYAFWDKIINRFYTFSRKQRAVYLSFASIFVLSLIGASLISTDYTIASTLPKRTKITEDFQYFEKNYSGFRPLEYAFFKKDSGIILDPASLNTIRLFENKLTKSPYVEQSASVADIFDLVSNYIPQHDQEEPDLYFKRIEPIINIILASSPDILLNGSKTKTRISAQIKDVGTTKVRQFSSDLNTWINSNVDTSVYTIRYTGTGVVLDKNDQYVRESLLSGLAFALIIIGILMWLFFKNFKMLFISFLPNALPLFIAAAILGFTGIPLEPLTSITFAVVFGIAVDDTIHFLSKYRMAILSGLDIEEAISLSFRESGKAILFTTLILFFGFMVMLFSYNPPSVIVGGLISLTLFSALFADLLLLPVLLRTFQIK